MFLVLYVSIGRGLITGKAQQTRKFLISFGLNAASHAKSRALLVRIEGSSMGACNGTLGQKVELQHYPLRCVTTGCLRKIYIRCNNRPEASHALGTARIICRSTI